MVYRVSYECGRDSRVTLLLYTHLVSKLYDGSVVDEYGVVELTIILNQFHTVRYRPSDYID